MAALLAESVCLPVPMPLDEARRRLLFAVLHLVDNDRSRAAAALGVTRGTLYQLCARYGVPRRQKPRRVGTAS
jgi:DNA-binding protein Fis